MEGLIFGVAYVQREICINRGVFCTTILGDLYLEGLIHGGAYFRNFTVTSFFSLMTFFHFTTPVQKPSVTEDGVLVLTLPCFCS